MSSSEIHAEYNRITARSWMTMKTFLFGLIISLIQIQSSSAAVTTYYGNLSFSSPTFFRYAGSGSFFYQAYTLNVNIGGNYVINSNSDADLMGYLYQDNFFPSQSDLNLIAFDDDGAGNRQFRINNTLVSSKTYVLVVTTYGAGIIGAFSFTASGPGYASAALMPTSSTVRPNPTTYSFPGTLSYFSPTFSPSQRPSGSYYFQAYRVTPSLSGTYTFTSSSTMDTYGYLYNAPFSSSSVSTNFITSDDDGGGSGQFRLVVSLSVGRSYDLIVSTYNAQTTGSFSVTVNGTGSLSVIPFNPSSASSSTTRPGSSSTTYSVYLSSSDPTFSRPGGSSYPGYRYAALRVTPYTSGTYTITTISSIDTYGCLYTSPVDPSYPSFNQLACDDDSGSGNQFLITRTLSAYQDYDLIVTTYSQGVTGSITVSVSGPNSVNIFSITPSTARPITTTSSYIDIFGSGGLSTYVIVIIACSGTVFALIVISVIVAVVSKNRQPVNRVNNRTIRLTAPTTNRIQGSGQTRVAYVNNPNAPQVHTIEEAPPGYEEAKNYPKF